LKREGRALEVIDEAVTLGQNYSEKVDLGVGFGSQADGMIIKLVDGEP
jgi:hypothetical protein